MADYTPVFTGGAKAFTATTSAAVTGGRILIASGNGTVAHSTDAAATFVGVAAHDAGSGARVTVWPLNNVIHEIEAAAAITAAGGVEAGANGQADPTSTTLAAAAAGGQLVGIALTTAAGSPLKVRFIGRG